MKNKIMKIWGIVLVVAVLAGLLVPAMPAAAANSQWSSVGTPNTGSTSNFLVATAAPGNSWLMDVAADGKNMFAYDNAAGQLKLYKSTNAGLSWTTSGIGVGLNGVALVAIAVSDDFANDTTVVAATNGAVFRSSDSGTNWGSIGTIGVGGSFATAVTPSATTGITSVAAAPHYLGGQAFLVGVQNNGAIGGGAFKFSTQNFAWTNLNLMAGAVPPAAAGVVDVYAVAFSPNTKSDAEVLAVTADGSNTYLETVFGTTAANSQNIGKATITTAPAAATTVIAASTNIASIAFAADFDTFSNHRVFVGLGSNAVVTPLGVDVYRINGGLTSTRAELEVAGTGSSTNVFSLSFKGNLADGVLYVGLQNSPVVWSAVGGTGAFNQSLKGPTGLGASGANTVVAASMVAADTNVWALTSGIGGALSLSTDKGVNFNQIALINISLGVAPAAAASNVSILDLEVIDANVMYLVLKDDRDASGTTTVGDVTTLFKTVNGGTNWMGVFTRVASAAANDLMTNLYPSPAYATDKTVYITQNDSRIWKSSNEGSSFIGLSSGTIAAVTAFAPVDANTYFVGGTNAIGKGGFTAPATISGSETPSSIAYVSATDMFVATTAGNVVRSTNGGVSFSGVGSLAAQMNGSILSNTFVAVDPAYATNKLVYAAGAGGIFRWTIDTSTSWTAVGATTMVNGFKLSGDGTLYATTSNVAIGLYRIVNPTGPAPSFTDNLNNATFALPNAAAVMSSSGNVLATGTAAVPNNTLFAVLGPITSPPGIPARIYTYQDTLVAAPAVTSPAAAAQVATTASLSWVPVTTGAVGVTYAVDVATDAALANKVVNSTATTAQTTGTQLILTPGTLLPGQDYWWRVRAMSPNNTKWSAVTKFSVLLSQPAGGLSGIGGNSMAPAIGATGVSTKPVFQWNAVLGAQSYDLQVSDNPVFVNPLDAQTGLNTTVWAYTKTLEANKTYYWRVRAVAASGVASDWVASSFTTAAPVVATTPATSAPAVTITAPAPPAVTITATPPARFFDPNSGLYFNTQQEMTQYQNAHPANAAAPAPATPAYIWVIIIIGAVLVIAVIVLITRTRRV